ncbi:MAG: hypothetical protein ACYS8I_14005 [Planctomycetota bacterium]|jgi:hypothetical protein
MGMLPAVFVVGIVAIVSSIILARLHRHKISSYVIALALYFLAFMGGGYAFVKTLMFLAPYRVFGITRTLDENISLVHGGQTKLSFSNGEEVSINSYPSLIIAAIMAFGVGAGAVFLPLKHCIFYITAKTSPAVYKHLGDLLPAKRHTT